MKEYEKVETASFFKECKKKYHVTYLIEKKNNYLKNEISDNIFAQVKKHIIQRTRINFRV